MRKLSRTTKGISVKTKNSAMRNNEKFVITDKKVIRKKPQVPETKKDTGDEGDFILGETELL